MQDYYNRIQAIKEEIGYEDYKKIMDKVTMFRHLELREQDRFIATMFEFPKLQSFLLESQMRDEGITPLINCENRND